MSKKITMSEEEYEAEAQRNYLVGQSVGLEEAAATLMKRAIEAFRRGDDKFAKQYRLLAQELKTRAEERHPGVPELEKENA